MFGLGVGLNDISVWSGLKGFFANGQNLFFNESSYNAYTAGSKTLASLSVLQSLGIVNTVATTNPPGTVTLKDGTIGYGAHNLVVQSANPSSAAWNWTGIQSKSVSGAVPPVGFNTAAYNIIEDTSTGVHFSNNGFCPNTTEMQCLWGVFKANGRSWVCLQLGGHAAFFNLATGAVGASVGLTAIIRDLGGGWYLCAVARVPTNTNTLLYICSADNTPTYAGNGSDGIVVAAYQLNRGPVPLHYVPTTTTAVYAPRIGYDRGATSNLIPYSQDLSSWVSNGDAGSIANQSDPWGGTTGFLKSTAGTRYVSAATVVGQIYTMSHYVYGLVGATYIYTESGASKFAIFDMATGTFTGSANVTGYGVELTPYPGWRRVWASFVADAASSSVHAYTSGAPILFSGAQLNPGAGPSIYLRTYATAPLYAAGTPKAQNLAAGSGTQSVTVVPGCVYTVLHQVGGTYTLSGAGSGTTTAGTATQVVATTSTLTLTASSSPTLLQVYEGTGTLPYVAGPYSEYPQDQLTREIFSTRETLQPRDLTQAAWTKSASMTAAKTAAGIDGEANSASTLTSAGVNQTALQSVTSASAARAFGAHIRSLSASSLTIDMTCDGGTTWQAITVNAAWMRYSVTQTAVTNPSYGFRLRASGDSIAVDFVQGEPASAPVPAFPTSPIWGVESAAQSRDADRLRTPSSWINDTGQTTLIEFVPELRAVGYSQVLLGRENFGWPSYITVDGGVGVYDMTSSANTGLVATPSGIPVRAATKYSVAGMAVSVNGSAVATTSFDGSMGNSGATVGLGDAPVEGYSYSGGFKRISIATTVATDTQLQQISAGTL